MPFSRTATRTHIDEPQTPTHTQTHTHRQSHVLGKKRSILFRASRLSFSTLPPVSVLGPAKSCNWLWSCLRPCHLFFAAFWPPFFHIHLPMAPSLSVSLHSRHSSVFGACVWVETSVAEHAIYFWVRLETFPVRTVTCLPARVRAPHPRVGGLEKNLVKRGLSPFCRKYVKVERPDSGTLNKKPFWL